MPLRPERVASKIPAASHAPIQSSLTHAGVINGIEIISTSVQTHSPKISNHKKDVLNVRYSDIFRNKNRNFGELDRVGAYCVARVPVAIFIENCGLCMWHMEWWSRTGI